MSFAAVDAAEPGPIFRTLAAELFGVFGIDSVHVCVLADGDTVATARCTSSAPAGRPASASTTWCRSTGRAACTTCWPPARP